MRKIAIITGASSGLGKEFAINLENFIKVDEIWLIARRKEKLKETAQILEEKKQNGNRFAAPRIIQMDISGRKGIETFQSYFHSYAEKETDKEFEIKVLINNAGFGTYGTFAETEIDKELDMIDLNCTALTGITGICLPYMQKNSIIINTASLAAFLPLGNFSVYAATKSFVLSFSTSLAAELAEKKIKVCALCPGPVSTEFAEIASNGARKKVKNGLPADRVAVHCLKKAVKGKHIAIMAFKWKFKAAASRFIDGFMGAKFTFKHCKRPNGKNGLK